MTRDEIVVDEHLIEKLKNQLNELPSLFSIKEYPRLGSLISCLAIKNEIDDGEMDRFSPYFGNVPLKASVFIQEERVGLRLRSSKRLVPRHDGFRDILDKSSIKNGELHELILFPSDIGSRYREKGVDLVIVRDWAIAELLGSESDKVKYLVANDWEIHNDTAVTQTNMLLNQQIPFFGTHDLVDHLLDFDIGGLSSSRGIAQKVIQGHKKTNSPSGIQKLLFYLIGILIDDLMQPMWYGSQIHNEAIEYLLSLVDEVDSSEDPVMSEWCHRFIFDIRNEARSMEQMKARDYSIAE